MADTTQTYQTHRKMVPLFHFVTLPILLVNFLAMIYHAWQDTDMYHLWAVAMGFAFLMAALFARMFALAAQDRVIRLEERLRLRELLPPEMKARIPEFTREQLIGLRFASDAELPDLAAAVLRDHVQKRDQVKKLVKHWRADDHQL